MLLKVNLHMPDMNHVMNNAVAIVFATNDHFLPRTVWWHYEETVPSQTCDILNKSAQFCKAVEMEITHEATRVCLCPG